MMNMDPRRYAWDQDSPWAIYAAGRWFGSRDDPAWQDRARIWAEQNSPVFREELYESKLSALALIRDLFFLHLTVRENTPGITAGLNRLKSLQGSQEHLGQAPPDIPFEPAADPDLVIHAWLFSTAVFSSIVPPVWEDEAAQRGREISNAPGTCSSGGLYNFLRGTLIVPSAEKIPGVAQALETLSARQEDRGFWPDLAPWQMYNLLAHSHHPTAEKMLDKLEGPLLSRQNRDGSWGAGAQKPLAALLMAHGMQNRNRLNG